MEESVNKTVATSAPQESTAKASSDADRNFALLRKQKEEALQIAERERQARLEMEERIRQIEESRSRQNDVDEEDDGEPYVDKRKLQKTLAKWDGKIEKQIEAKVEARLAQERQKDFLFRLKSEFRDFDDVMNTDTVQKFSETNPDLAEEILAIPDEYKRRKMAYQTIKSLRLHEKPKPQESIQDRIEQNQRNPYYRPSMIAAPPPQAGDFTAAGQKSAYERMKQLQARVPGRA